MKVLFPIIPASGGPLWLFVVVLAFCAALAGLFGYLAYSSRNVRFELSSDALRIGGDIYGRTIPMEALLLDEAGAVNLTRDSEYQLKWRTNGAGLPGYSSGWFKLKNDEKALVFVTDKTQVLRVPTREGYSLLMSIPDPEQLLHTARGMR